MVCPNCNSSALKRVSLIHAAGLYQSQGRFRGFLLGSSEGLHFGRYRGTSQSQLSIMVGPPKKGRYLAPTILWLLGFFVVMAFAGRGKLTTPMAIVSVAYLFLLPAFLIGTLAYNYFVYPKKYRTWERTYMCQRCGTLAEIPAGTCESIEAHV